MVVQAGDDDQVGAGEPGEGAVGGEGEPAAQGNGRGVGGRAVEVEGGYAAVGAVDTPDLGDDRDVEGSDAGEGEECDALGVGASAMHGSKPSVADFCASGGGRCRAGAWCPWQWR